MFRIFLFLLIFSIFNLQAYSERLPKLANDTSTNNPKCECPQINVNCNNEVLGKTCGELAVACATGCDLFVSSDACLEHGL